MGDVSIGDVEIPHLDVTPAGVDTAGTLTAHRPDGTSETVPVTAGTLGTDPDTGQPTRRLTADAVTFTMAGRWVLAWQVTGTGTGAEDVEIWVVASPAAGGPVPLYSHADLENYLQQGELASGPVTVGRRVVSGWLRHATALTAWPDPIPDDLFAWGMELGGLVYNNPELLSSDTTGGSSSTWDKDRRQRILDAARDAYNEVEDSDGFDVVPVWSFPDPCWTYSAW